MQRQVQARHQGRQHRQQRLACERHTGWRQPSEVLGKGSTL
jgi:hypothetical protein